MVHILGETNSVLNRFVAELRDVNIQTDLMRFRRNLERCGEVMAYEISKTLNYNTIQVQTPLGVADVSVPTDTLVLATILRAGLPMHQGFLNMFDTAQNAFISAFRKYNKDGTFTIQFDHISSPRIEGKVLVLIDPMLATGASMALAHQAIVQKGMPVHTHFASIVASREGVKYMQQHFNKANATIWLGAIDDELTVKSYIVPGLGDAGDLAYGEKE